MTPTASPSSTVRGILKDVIETEFEPEGLTVLNDRLHASLGSEGAIAAVYPLDENEADLHAEQLVTRVRVQVFGHWDKEVDNQQTVDPSDIEGWAHRFRVALRGNTQGSTGDFWFLRLTELSYPPDPTGNITRFEATVMAWGGNSGLVETGT